MESKSDGQNAHRGRGQQRWGQARGNSRSKGGGGRDKKRDMGRGEWSRTYVDKRARNEAEQDSKRRKLGTSEEQAVSQAEALQTNQEVGEKEERKPKRKVAVLIGYSGSGYKGMQLNGTEKTIEGDIFAALVAAGAISKANADDPKKSSLVRCARTDKGVHAAGNVISLKLIVEDPEIVQKINHELSSQIRVWGIERTNASFSCYQACDSRVYEYLIPTHTFLPPHPQSYLGKKIVELAESASERDGLQDRQKEVSKFWAEVESSYIKPILANLDQATRELVEKALYESTENARPSDKLATKKSTNSKDGVETSRADEKIPEELDEYAKDYHSINVRERSERSRGEPEENRGNAATVSETATAATVTELRSPLDVAIKSLKAAYILAKKRYRISAPRLAQVQSALDQYIGTRNFHNYTVNKAFRDPSAKRVIKSFKLSPTPIIINDTEWLSLKVHGQSFMMHQIRKMVSMAALVVRCGCPTDRILETYGEDYVSIPKAPGLGLLLERPVFDSYNERAISKLGRGKIDFSQFEKEMEEFKQREVYERIFREEEQENQFHAFFSHIDNFKSEDFLYLTSAGMSAAKKRTAKGGKPAAVLDSESDDEELKGGEAGEG
ncbi:MAG: tRNA pseudouridine synthase 1 [Candelina mexicana]|nr:MAG: tRNA pseudouridine synthase 1 [Candelina mexicana]